MFDYPTLTINQLVFERNQQPLFAPITAQINMGEMLQISGCNGSGKSTLLRMLAGFIEPHQGGILWGKKSILQQRDSYQQQLHYIGHQNALRPSLTVYENLQLISTLFLVKSNEAQLLAILQQLGLQDFIHTQVRFLSAGLNRRLSLAKLLLTNRCLWLLDEPATALDAQGQSLLQTLIEQHLLHHGIIIMATHQAFHLSTPIQSLHLRPAA